MKTHSLMTQMVTMTMLMAGSAQSGERLDLRVRDDFFAGFGGDRARLERAMQTTAAALAEDRDDAEALVWHGGGLFFQSGEAFRQGDAALGIELSRRGLDEMDRAVSLAPDRVGVRIPRGAVLLTATRVLPPSAAATALLEKGLADYAHAVELQKAYFDTLSDHARGEVLFGLAEGTLRAGDTARARQWFEKLAADRDAAHTAQARAWLESGRWSGGTACAGCHVK